MVQNKFYSVYNLEHALIDFPGDNYTEELRNHVIKDGKATKDDGTCHDLVAYARKIGMLVMGGRAVGDCFPLLCFN